MQIPAGVVIRASVREKSSGFGSSRKFSDRSESRSTSAAQPETYKPCIGGSGASGASGMCRCFRNHGAEDEGARSGVRGKYTQPPNCSDGAGAPRLNTVKTAKRKSWGIYENIRLCFAKVIRLVHIFKKWRNRGILIRFFRSEAPAARNALNHIESRLNFRRIQS